MKQAEPVVMYWDIHKAGLQTGALVLCERCNNYKHGAVSVGPGQFADGACKLHGAVFARCPFDCPDYKVKKGDR